jgi:hypothetical protein
LQGAIDAYGSQGGGGAAAPRATSAAPTQRRRKKKKGNAASHLSVSVRASMLEAKKLSGFAPNLHGRTMPARYGKDSKQTITVGRGSRYAVAHYPTMDAAAEDNFEGKLYSGVGKQTSSTLQSSPFTHLGSATRKDNNNRGFLSEEAPPAAGAEGTARQNPGPTFKYTACAPQYDSEKRSMPCGVFGQDNRCGLDEMFMDQLQGETWPVRVGALQRVRTEFDYITKEHIDAVMNRAPNYSIGRGQRPALHDGESCSPGPIYDGLGLDRMGSAQASTPGTSVRKPTGCVLAGGMAFGQEFDDRPYELFAQLGKPTHYSKVRSVPRCGFGRYSSREQPVYGKLDKNW